MKRLFICCFALISLPLLLQAQEYNVEPLLKQHARQPFIYLLKSEEVNVQSKGNNMPVVKARIREELLICKNNYQSVRSKKVRSSLQAEVSNISARLCVYNGKKHHPQKLEITASQIETRGGSTFFDDDKYFTIQFPGAKEGDIVQIDYDITYPDPRYFGIFFFSDYYPAVHNLFSITCPKNQIGLKTKAFNFQEVQVKFQVDSTSKKVRMTWRADTVPALTEEYMDGSFKTKGSSVLASIESYNTPTGRVFIGGSLEKLFHWYSEFLKKVDMGEDLHLKTFTDSLVQNCNGDIEKLKAIYTWVQDKIAYVAYEDGMNGYIPRDASVVYSYRYGDCKDMSNLLSRLCHFAGLPVYPAWIGTRDIPYQFSDFPSAFCTNHMIAVYIAGADTLFLDPTGKNHPFGLATSMIQGKEALISLGADKFALARVPHTANSVSLEKDSIHLVLRNGNEIIGKGIYTLTGYEKLRLPAELTNNSFEKQKQQIYKLVHKGNNKFRLDTFYIMNQNQRNQVRIYYEFMLPDYAVRSDDRVMLNMNFNKNYFDDLLSEKRKYGIDLPYKSTHQLFVSLSIDQDQKLEFVPEGLQVSNHLFSIKTNYQSSASQVLFTNTIAFEQLCIPEKELGTFSLLLKDYTSQKSKLISISGKNK